MSDMLQSRYRTKTTYTYSPNMSSSMIFQHEHPASASKSNPQFYKLHLHTCRRPIPKNNIIAFDYFPIFYSRMIIFFLIMILAARVDAFSTKMPMFAESMDGALLVGVGDGMTASCYDDVIPVPMTNAIQSRRNVFKSMASSVLASSALTTSPWKAAADDDTTISEVQVAATGDVKKLFNEGRALEAQGNILAAQRLYIKVTTIAPRFIYGWSNLGNTLVAQGKLREADESYTNAINLCEENLKQVEGSSFGTRRCDDLYLILLNRGSVRLNNDMPKEALLDLNKSSTLRGRPDATILQNLVRNRMRVS